MGQKSNQQPKQRRKLMLKLADDDTLKAAQILDGFSVNEVESIMHCKESNQRSQRKKRTNEKKSKYEKIVWNALNVEADSERIVETWEKMIDERIRLEMMMNKLKQHCQHDLLSADGQQTDQFYKIKQKHQEHLNEYQAMINKFQKHK